MSVEYDPAILQSFADKLYRRANTIIAAFTIYGAVLCGGLAYAAGLQMKPQVDIWLPASVIGGLIGLAIGFRKSFYLKLEAQRTLCQMHTADNTRAAAELLQEMTKAERSQSARA